MHALHSLVTIWLQTLSALFMLGLVGSTAVLAFSFWEDIQTVLGRG